MKNKLFLVFLWSIYGITVQASDPNKVYALWYNRPAFNRGGDFSRVMSGGFPYDEDWERWSLPIGNGALGACIFGRTDVERIQLTEKTLGNKGAYGMGGITGFAEIYLDIHHAYAKNYKRTLCLNNAVATVSYQYDGVEYSREYFANYPDRVIAVKLKADHPGMVSFTLRPVLPYLHPYNSELTGRTGQVEARDNVIIMQGKIQYFNLDYEGQVKVINYGGVLSGGAAEEKGILKVTGADSVVLLIAAATSYQLKDSVFLKENPEKFRGNTHPHDWVCERIRQSGEKGYEVLRREHIADYQYYFNRVELKLTEHTPSIPTDQLLSRYRSGKAEPYLEELFFQYGRYLLIASSRSGSLPAHLQGAWNQYEYAPWSGGYWHNVNVQMNYWPVFNTNLAELFDAYMVYNEAFRQAAVKNAVRYIQENNPGALAAEPTENGWTIGTGATAFAIEGPGGHSGPGTGGFTTKLFWDYYDFIRDKELLKEHVYPAILGMAKFLSRTLQQQKDGTWLTVPSFSPEQRQHGRYYATKGCIFDQSMILENFNDLLKAANLLGKKEPFLETVKEQTGKLDAIQIGASGQIKEYREENKYGEIGEYRHRHISQLCGLYPGTSINANTPELLEAAKITLQERGDKSTGWAMAHRLNLWARAKEGNKAYQLYQLLLKKGVLENLWGLHPPFQIDANFGGTAGIAEMLLQSHEGYIEPLAALPDSWQTGSFKGLMARGNFQVDAEWQKGRIVRISILSNKGGSCRLKVEGIQDAKIIDGQGKRVKTKDVAAGLLEFPTKKGELYQVCF